MELQPLRQAPRPGYPTREEWARRSSGQAEAALGRWSLRAEVALAASVLMALGVAACKDRLATPEERAEAKRRTVTAVPASPDLPAPTTARRAELARTIVAPVFEFGEGRGATGCVVVSPPAYLSEEEAMLVIREELAKNGIALGPGGILPGASVAPRWRTTLGGDRWDDTYDLREQKERRVPLEVDGTDPASRVSVVFISDGDYAAVGIDGGTTRRVDSRGHLGNSGSGASASTVDFREAAHYVASRAADSGMAPVRLGVFYDPLVDQDVTAFSAEDEEAAVEGPSSTDLLRMQVRSFVTWLEQEADQG